MALKHEKCCFSVELQVGCIVIGIIEVLLGITVVGLFPGTSMLEEVAISIIGSVSLIAAALNTKGSTHIRIRSIFVYIGTQGVLLVVEISRWKLILIIPGSGDWTWNILGSYHLYVGLNVFFILVAIFFYQE